MPPPRDFTTLQKCLDSIKYEYDQARQQKEELDEQRSDLNTWRLTQCPADCKAGIDYIYYALGDISSCLYGLINESVTPANYYGVPYFLEFYSGGGAVDITWKDIIQAWSEISDAARIWTITSIDQMRQNIWSKDPKIKWNENPFE